MISVALKKERADRAESRRNMYRSGLGYIDRVTEIDGRKCLCIVDQTPASEEYINYAGWLSSDISMLVRLHDETQLKSALAKMRLLEQADSNYDGMSNEEIAARIKPRGVQTVSDYARYYDALNEMEFNRLSSRVQYNEDSPVIDTSPSVELPEQIG